MEKQVVMPEKKWHYVFQQIKFEKQFSDLLTLGQFMKMYWFIELTLSAFFH